MYQEQDWEKEQQMKDLKKKLGVLEEWRRGHLDEENNKIENAEIVIEETEDKDMEEMKGTEIGIDENEKKENETEGNEGIKSGIEEM